jgi:short-subunit dehydrogenase involved in D-alanine esterification of teichoic acids
MNYNSNIIEETIAVHLISPFKLSYELLSQLNKNSQIINNTSAGLYTQKLDMELIKKNFN